MRKLIQGLHIFQSEIFDSQRALFERLVDGQEPEVLFITCSDSRINPNLITQTAPGDLFILRNAGNLIPPHGAQSSGEAATIEFAVSALGVADIIVCGHSHCGAMKALLDPTHTENLPYMRSWLCHAEATRVLLRENYSNLTPEEQLIVATEENVLVQLENLRTHPSVHARLASKRLRLHGWVYVIETGEVRHYDPNQGQFVPLAQQPPQTKPTTKSTAKGRPI